ncbi:MAG TPA: nuclear transport factor 2 family protein [Terriglobales bacterium]|nr:nuclear transport factor 2 family protein [Terriglobales bacterium]
MRDMVFAILIGFGGMTAAFSQTVGNAAAATPVNSIPQVLISQSEAVAQAEKSRDINALQHLLTADFQQVGSEGRLHDREDLLDDAREGKLQDYRLYNFKVLAVDQGAAIVTYDAIIHKPEGDAGLAPRYQHLSDVWVKQGDQWQLRFQQATARRPID